MQRQTKYAITFQQRYAHDEHPTDKRINHRSYVLVEAKTFREAYDMARSLFDGEAWAMAYPFDAAFYDQITDYDLVEVVL